jgi:hypothetical protein
MRGLGQHHMEASANPDRCGRGGRGAGGVRGAASAAPARHGDIVHGHKIGVKRAGQRAHYGMPWV